MLLFLFFSTSLGIDALPGSAGVFPAPGVPTTLPRSASTNKGHRAVVYSTSVDHLFYVSASARNDATLSVSVGGLFVSPFFLEELGELARVCVISCAWLQRRGHGAEEGGLQDA